MTWDYRIVKDPKEDWFGIYEVFYNEEGIPSPSSEKPERVQGENVKEIRGVLKRMKRALDLPILEDKDFVGKFDIDDTISEKGFDDD